VAVRGRSWANAVVALVAGVVVVVGAPAAGAEGDPGTGTEAAAGPVVVVGVAGLRWSDVDAAATPALAGVVREGSVGVLSVRSAPAVTCPAEGWVTLGAGTYAAVTDPGSIDPAAGCAARPIPDPVAFPDPAPAPDAVPTTDPAVGPAVVAPLPDIDALNRDLRFGARVGWLSRRLGCVATVGDGAALAAATADGLVAHHRPALPAPAADLAATFTTCPTTLVDAGALPEGDRRAAALGAFDTTLGRVRDALPPGVVLLVLGLAEVDARRPHLHVAAATGPGFAGGYLRSGSTRRTPYVQLVDVAPTVVQARGEPVPDAVAGRPFTGGHLRAERPDRLGETVAGLVDADRRAVQQRRVLPVSWLVLGTALALSSAALSWALARRHRGRPVPRRLVEALRLTALGMTAVPAATFVANLAPWWRAPAPAPVLLAAVGAVALGLLGVAVAVGRAVHRRRPSAATSAAAAHAEVATVAGASVLVFVGDALSGARLQIDSLLGYNALHAGRFVGFGNVAFAVLGAGAVLAASLLAAGRPRRAAWAAVAAVAVPVLAVDGAPHWGADFGGVLTLVPTFAVLALLVGGAGLTWRRLLAAQAAGGLVVAVVAWLDYRRPAEARSHFGRFVGTVVDGTAWATIERKALTSWELLFVGPHTRAALVLTVALVVVVARSPVLARVGAVDPALRPMLTTTVALALIGFATNDSGVAIPAVVALVAVPATLVLCTSTLYAEAPPPSAP
jgi:hypothetical protein